MSVTDIMYLNPSFKQVPVNALNKQLDFSSPIIFICFPGSTDTGVGLHILNELELHVAKFCDQNDQKNVPWIFGHSSRQHYKAAISLLDKQLSGVEIAKNKMKWRF